MISKRINKLAYHFQFFNLQAHARIKAELMIIFLPECWFMRCRHQF